MKERLKTLYLGILAGAAIAFGGLLFLFASAFIPADFIIDRKLIGALLFPVGLLLVCYFKFYLYTGKIGIAFNPGVKKESINVFEWLLYILIGNAIGAALIGIILYLILLPFDGSLLKEAVKAAGESRITPFTFEGIFSMTFKSILCGMLVYLGILFFNLSNNHFVKVSGIVVTISFFVYAGFQHCVANMFYLTAALLWNLNSFVGLLLCIVGNSIGALILNVIAQLANKATK